MDKKEFIKLSALVDGEFTVKKVYYPKYKMWDNEARKMLVSERWEKGYRKIYGTETDKGILDLSQGQLGGMLETVSKGGEANIIGRTFSVKSNGKTGMDIRYYINAKPQDRADSPEWDKAREIFNNKDEINTGQMTQEEIEQIPF